MGFKRVPFVLASSSPRRRRLMAAFPFPVVVKAGRWKEPAPSGRVRPRRWAVKLAKGKARNAARGFKRALVLGADTLVYQGGKILGKPASARDARRMLEALQGRWHRVYTGLALAAKPGGRIWTDLAVTRVKMRPLSARRMDALSRRNHDKAGAYAAQDRRNPFVEKTEGDFDNVVGLPRRGVRRLLRKAKRAGFIPLSLPTGPGRP